MSIQQRGNFGDGTHALEPLEGYDPLTVVAEGREDDVGYTHHVTFFWNTREQLMVQIWNQSADVQAAGAKALTLSEAKQLLAWLKRTIPEMEGHR